MGNLKLAENKNKGFTIVELLISIAILVIVIAMGYMFYFYVVRSFYIASKQSEVQQNVRIVKSMMENYVRYSRVIIANNLEDKSDYIDKGYQVIYLGEIEDDGYGIIKYIDKDGNPERDLLGAISEGVGMKVEFKKINDSFLWIYVKGKIEEEYEYDIGSEILIHKVVADEPTIEGNIGSVIYFYTPPPSK